MPSGNALEEAGVAENDVLVYATTQKKSGEKGLIQAISTLSGNLIFLDDDTINAQSRDYPVPGNKDRALGCCRTICTCCCKKKAACHEKENLWESYGCHRTLNQEKGASP